MGEGVWWQCSGISAFICSVVKIYFQLTQSKYVVRYLSDRKAVFILLIIVIVMVTFIVIGGEDKNIVKYLTPFQRGIFVDNKFSSPP